MHPEPVASAVPLPKASLRRIRQHSRVHAYVGATNAVFLQAGGSVAEYAAGRDHAFAMRWFKFDRSQTRIELLPDGGGLFFYRRLKFSVFASRIRLVRWLHTVLNRDSSQHHWVSDSI
jgi:hypothetical protein